jgi:hypothetical protein
MKLIQNNTKVARIAALWILAIVLVVGMLFLIAYILDWSTASDLALNIIAEFFIIIITIYYFRFVEEVWEKRKSEPISFLRYAILLKRTRQLKGLLEANQCQPLSKKAKTSLTQALELFEVAVDSSTDFLDHDAVEIIWPLIYGDLAIIPTNITGIEDANNQFKEWKDSLEARLDRLELWLKERGSPNYQ